MTGSPFCNYGWDAPRIDVLDQRGNPVYSVPVRHVCALDINHAFEHRCSCGAMTPK
jgi:hypothetical protein